MVNIDNDDAHSRVVTTAGIPGAHEFFFHADAIVQSGQRIACGQVMHATQGHEDGCNVVGGMVKE